MGNGHSHKRDLLPHYWENLHSQMIGHIHFFFFRMLLYFQGVFCDFPRQENPLYQHQFQKNVFRKATINKKLLLTKLEISTSFVL